MSKLKTKIKSFLLDSRVAFLSATMLFLGYPSVSLLAQDNLGNQVLTNSTQQLTNLLTDLVALLRVVMGLGAIVVLAIVIFKVFKGDREAAEKLAWWVAGLTLGFTLMSVVANLIK